MAAREVDEQEPGAWIRGDVAERVERIVAGEIRGREDGPPLHRLDAHEARLAAAVSVEEFALGLSRCGDCRARAECGKWLAAGGRDGYQDFCPNAAFVERVTKATMR